MKTPIKLLLCALCALCGQPAFAGDPGSTTAAPVTAVSAADSMTVSGTSLADWVPVWTGGGGLSLPITLPFNTTALQDSNNDPLLGLDASGKLLLSGTTKVNTVYNSLGQPLIDSDGNIYYCGTTYSCPAIQPGNNYETGTINFGDGDTFVDGDGNIYLDGSSGGKVKFGDDSTAPNNPSSQAGWIHVQVNAADAWIPYYR